MGPSHSIGMLIKYFSCNFTIAFLSYGHLELACDSLGYYSHEDKVITKQNSFNYLSVLEFFVSSMLQ